MNFLIHEVSSYKNNPLLLTSHISSHGRQSQVDQVEKISFILLESSLVLDPLPFSCSKPELRCCTSTRVFNLTAPDSFTPPFSSETRDRISLPAALWHTVGQTGREVVRGAGGWAVCHSASSSVFSNHHPPPRGFLLTMKTETCLWEESSRLLSGSMSFFWQVCRGTQSTAGIERLISVWYPVIYVSKPCCCLWSGKGYRRLNVCMD